MQAEARINATSQSCRSRSISGRFTDILRNDGGVRALWRGIVTVESKYILKVDGSISAGIRIVWWMRVHVFRIVIME